MDDRLPPPPPPPPPPPDEPGRRFEDFLEVEESYGAPYTPPDRSNVSVPRWLFIIIIILAICGCLCIVSMVVMTLFGPTIGNVLSNIIEELATPTP